MHIHSSIIHNSRKVEPPKGPLTDDWINKMWCITYNGMLFTHIKEGDSDTHHNTDEV